MVKVAPSLLSANFAYLKEEINAIKAADWIHYLMNLQDVKKKEERKYG